MYILRPVSLATPFETEFVVMLQSKTFIGSRCTIPPPNRAQFLAAWKTRLPQSSGIYEDENGRWISGYAPILNRAGVTTGDELQHLGSVFNEMIISLGEKLALLPYVSRFTAKAVRRSRDDPQWLAGSESQTRFERSRHLPFYRRGGKGLRHG